MVTIILQIKLFLFIMACFVLFADIFHVISVLSLKKGKLISSEKDLVIFGISLSYIITMLITGF